MKRVNILFCSALVFVFVFSTGLISSSCNSGNAANIADAALVSKSDTDNNNALLPPPSLTLDTALYDATMVRITNGDSSGKWPVKADYPRAGAVLPFIRII